MFFGPEFDSMFNWLFRFAVFGAICAVGFAGWGAFRFVEFLIEHYH